MAGVNKEFKAVTSQEKERERQREEFLLLQSLAEGFKCDAFVTLRNNK